MPAENALQREWFEIATKDMRRAALLLADGDAGGAAFFVQQAAEKALKGFMLAHGWTLERAHDLEALLDDAVGFQPDLQRFRSFCEEASPFYMADRYPATIRLALEDVRKPMKDCRELMRSVGIEL